MKIPKKLWIPLASVALYAVAGFLVAPPILRSQLAKGLSGALHRPVTVGKVSLNPFALSVTVRDVLVREAGGTAPFFSFGELYVNAESSSLWKRGLVLREVRLSKPFVSVTRTDAGVYNFSDLLSGGGSQQKKAPAGKPFRFAVGNIQILQGSADFQDLPKKTNHTVRELGITVPFVSNFPAFLETFVQPALSATVDGHSLSVKGESKPFTNSLETSATLELKDFEIPKYVEYLPFKVAARLPSALFDTKTRVSYVQYRDRGPSLTVNGDVALRKVVLDDEKGAPLLRLPLASAAFGPVEIFAKSARVAKVHVEGLELQASRSAKGRWNWAAAVPGGDKPAPAGAGSAPEEEPKAAESEGKPFSFQVDEIGLSGAKIGFEDLARGTPFRTVVSPLEVSVRGLTNAAGAAGNFTVSLKTEASEALEVQGTLGLTPVKTDGTVKLSALRLAKYAPFYDEQIRFALKGALDLGSQYQYEARPEGPLVLLKGLSVALSSLEGKRPEEPEPFLRLPSLRVKDGELDLGRKKVVLGSVSGEKGALHLLRVGGDTWNVAQLTAPSPPAAPSPAPRKSARAADKGKKTADTPWTVTMAALHLKDFGVRVTDHEPDDSARLSFSKINVDAANLSTAPRTLGRLALSAALNKQGSLSAKGTVSLSPVTANLTLALKGAEIAPFQPYFTEKLNVFVNDGAVSADGGLTVGAGGAGTKGMPVTYNGGLLVSGFSLSDKSGVEEIAKFGTLALNGIDLKTEPMVVKIEGISLADFNCAVAVEQGGRLNLLDLVEAEPKPAPAPAPAEPAPAPSTASPPAAVAEKTAPRIEVKTVTLQGGRVRFTDRNIKPVYSSTLDELGGRVSGLTSQEGLLADVDFRARLNGYAPIEITGRVNPLQKDPYVDLKAAVKGMDMSGTTPYSGRYLGYTIQQGKLFLDVRYRIDKRKLDSQNVIIFDRLTLGDKVESPQATSIPVRFGLALLTDRNGQIHIDVPIDGNLDDPKFHIGKVVWNVIINLLAKAATSPFALLGSMFGGGEELGFVDFDPGASALGAPSLKKVDTLAKALRERPALRLEVTGRTDPGKDREALKELLYARKIKAQKAKEILKSGESVAAVDALRVAPEELTKYLTLAYKAEKFPKPKNVIGFDKDLPPAEMEKLIRSHLQVTDDDLRLLAAQRAETVRDAFVKTGQVDANRVFLVEADKESKEQAAKAPAPRVEFALK